MKIKGDKVCNSTLKVVKLYVGAGHEVIVGGTAAGRKGFVLFHKLPKGIAVPWGVLLTMLWLLNFPLLIGLGCRSW